MEQVADPFLISKTNSCLRIHFARKFHKALDAGTECLISVLLTLPLLLFLSPTVPMSLFNPVHLFLLSSLSYRRKMKP